MIVFILLCFCD